MLYSQLFSAFLSFSQLFSAFLSFSQLFSAFLSFYLHTPYIFPKRPGDPLGICGVQYSWAHTHIYIYIFLYRLLA